MGALGLQEAPNAEDAELFLLHLDLSSPFRDKTDHSSLKNPRGEQGPGMVQWDKHL